jgi:preprotein translocase SecE subunit
MELLKELFRFRRYKNSQGRLIRKLTMWGVWVLFCTAAWKCTLMDFTGIAEWYAYFAGWNAELKILEGEEAAALLAKKQAFVDMFVPIFTYTMSGVIALFGLWFGYRLVQWETFADFLISVEAEMAKVSWPGKAELRSSTVVVLVVFMFLAGMFLIYDLGLLTLFRWVGIQ